MVGAEVYELLGQLREWVRDQVEQVRTTMALFVGIARTSSAGDEDEVKTDDQSKETTQVRRIEPWGLRWRPPSGVMGAILRAAGGVSNGMLIGISTKRYGPANLAQGEVELYCVATGTSVKLDKDGKITITAASGQDVVVNGGTLKVAREHDALNVGTLTGMSPAGPVNFVYVPGGFPAPGAPQTGPSITVGGIVADGTGAAHFKG